MVICTTYDLPEIYDGEQAWDRGQAWQSVHEQRIRHCCRKNYWQSKDLGTESDWTRQVWKSRIGSDACEKCR